ncbi:hypothetical protein B0T24DRAFT_594697 [Lasiosphaeria ovina]|uniref:C2H2-type domain-containing protein n=1 Tax=Lasiosphaeria ovina TaxID=92902 RepID=A0AAE0K664_9PEZI|nr:hypothetical protein B0T24DRAFT_594697 [Lasiosphaeria ovina]
MHAARGDHPANQDPTSSETSASSSDTDSDSDPDSDDLLPSSSAAAHALALSDRSYADLCRNIVLFAYPKFLAWSASARYMAPPEQRVRARTTRRRRRETDTNSRASAMSATATAVGTMTPRRYVEEAPDPSSPHVVIISPIDGYYHLACPFYRANPARHGACVVAPSSRRRRRGLQSVPDVVRHVVRHHRKPASCPVCSRVFASELAAEAHVRALSCKAPAVLVPVEGVTYRMAAELARQQRRDAGSARGRRPEADRWRRVFATVLPGADADQAQHAAVCSPYLTDGLGLAVSLLRDYWSAHGYECIAEYLAGRDDGQLLLERDSDALAALDSGVFEDLLAKVVGEHAE